MAYTLKKMPVDVSDHADRAVTEALGHDFDGHAGGDAERRGPVTQIAQPDHPQRARPVAFCTEVSATITANR